MLTLEGQPSNSQSLNHKYMSTTETKNEIGTFSKILVAIDGSKQSMDAAYYAINVTNKFNAERVKMKFTLWICLKTTML